jgi:hypothetical protein
VKSSPKKGYRCPDSEPVRPAGLGDTVPMLLTGLPQVHFHAEPEHRKKTELLQRSLADAPARQDGHLPLRGGPLYRLRRHSSLNYQSPDAFEADYLANLYAVSARVRRSAARPRRAVSGRRGQ